MLEQPRKWTVRRSVVEGTWRGPCGAPVPWRHPFVALFAVLALAACAPGTRLFQLGPRPAELVGTWVDSTQATNGLARLHGGMCELPEAS